MDIQDFFRMYDDFIYLENLPIFIKATGLDIYDFRFRDVFECRSIHQPADQPVLLRIGAIPDFPALERTMKSMGMTLLFTNEQHNRASLLENWYPLLAELTPYSRVYTSFPSLEQLLQDFSFPVFIKGNRQTNHHKRHQSIIENTGMYDAIKREWSTERQLYWQKIVVREFIPLLTIDDTSYPDMIPISYEFRVFFWKGMMMGYSPYWQIGNQYTLAEADEAQALFTAQKAADLINIPFLAVDVAKTRENQWIVIEINDAQESGYAGCNPMVLWRNMIAFEKEHSQC